ncbi:hypothetical protein TWF481_007514 [Arthrobotrys musiformis]|uniref:Uncharacterized protein n=1 Tax=Arthrobotrys musiformis TaxID=47236 RepID=A0AAV9WDA2_9PEZI
MPSENDELLARISQLAGQINRHKASVASSTPSSRPQHQQPSYPTTRHQPYPPPHAHHAHHASHRGRGPSSWAPARGAASYRGRGRGGRQIPSGHRNRSLVLNNSAPASGNNSRGETPTTGTDDEAMTDVNDAVVAPAPVGSNGSTAAPNSGNWVAKRDRHMQLINSSVYDQHLQIRAKAIEQTRQDRLKKKEENEKAKLRSFLQGSKQYAIVNTVGRVKSKPTNVATYQHEIVINGARYKITVDGSKLVKVSDDAKKPTPKTAVVGGVTFYRSKGGNLWRAGVVRRQQRSVVNHPLFSSHITFSNQVWLTRSTYEGVINLQKGKLRNLANFSHQPVSFSFLSLIYSIFLLLIRYREQKYVSGLGRSERRLSVFAIIGSYPCACSGTPLMLSCWESCKGTWTID